MRRKTSGTWLLQPAGVSHQNDTNLVLVGASLALLASGVCLVVQAPYVALGFSLVLSAFGLALSVVSTKVTLSALIVWTTGLGSFRRIAETSSASHFSLLSEPLVAVGCLTLMGLFYKHRLEIIGSRPSALSRLIALFSVLVVLEIPNPLQGGIFIGLGGAVLLAPGFLSFFIARAALDAEAFTAILRTAIACSIFVAGYGLLQEYVGFPIWDHQWITHVSMTSYVALNVGRVVRPFASLSSAEEYGVLLSIGVLLLLSGATRRTVLLRLLICGPLVFALLQESSRSILLFTVAGVSAIVSARKQLRGRSLAVVATAMILGLIILSGLLGGSSTAATAGTNQLTSHEFAGLAHPLDSNSSTLPGHVTSVFSTIGGLPSYPLGKGAGATSNAATSFGGTNESTDLDFSNVALSFGLLGLILYLAIFIIGFKEAYSVARQKGNKTALSALSILVACIFEWVNGGIYLPLILLWLALGWLDNSYAESRRAEYEGVLRFGESRQIAKLLGSGS